MLRLPGAKVMWRLGAVAFVICVVLALFWLLNLQGGVSLVLHPPKEVGGLLPAQQQALLSALKSTSMGSQVRGVRVGTDGATKVARVEFTAGTIQESQVNRTSIERTAATVLRTGFGTDPHLDELDLVAAKPVAWKGKRQITRVVFSAAARRERVADALNENVPPAALVAGTGQVYWAPTLVDRAPRVAAQSKNADIGLGQDANPEVGRAHGEVKIPVLFHGDPTQPMVALTFDDGPHAIYTPLVLDILRRKQVKATFFIVGIEAREFPELLHRIAADGHVIGNHTYSHIRLIHMSRHEAVAELRIADNIIEEITGHKSRWYRPPGGACDETVLKVLSQLGYVPVLWTQNTGDWANPPLRRIVAKALYRLGNGSIILMHCDGIKTIQALPTIIDLIRARGLHFGTVADLAREHGCQHLSPGAVVRLAYKRPLLPLPGWLTDRLYAPE